MNRTVPVVYKRSSEKYITGSFDEHFVQTKFFKCTKQLRDALNSDGVEH
jgi:hypothetical protein